MDIPLELVNNFSTIDECKPTIDGSELLVVSRRDCPRFLTERRHHRRSISNSLGVRFLLLELRTEGRSLPPQKQKNT